MNYELAKELKDAGFPQVGESKQYLPAFTSEVYIPTLSELVEACGDQGFQLEKGRSGWGGSEGNWNASKAVDGKLVISSGSTTEEAVARLWLALNKK
jgi:hypothetical protein